MSGRLSRVFGVRIVFVWTILVACGLAVSACSKGGGSESRAGVPKETAPPGATPAPGGASTPDGRGSQPVESPKGPSGPGGPDDQPAEPPKAPVGLPGDQQPDAPKNPGGVPTLDPEADVTIAPMPNKMKYAGGVVSERRAALDEAISVLYVLPLKKDDARLRQVMKLQTVAPADLQNWLEARVQYVVDEDFSFKDQVFETGRAFAYQNSGVLPNAEQGLAESNSSTVMSNLGAGIYFVGKKYKTLLGVHLGGEIGDVAVTSPRIGLLKIGAGLFPNLGANVTKQNLWLDIYRAGTLFHEARHSDGRGKTLSFMHAKCPDNSDYKGAPACDLSANGPYTVGAMIHKNLMNNCDQCSERSRAVLQISYLDFSSRVLKGKVKVSSHHPPEFNAKPVDWDDQPEGSR